MTRAISRVPKSSGPQPKRWQAERGRLAEWGRLAARRARVRPTPVPQAARAPPRAAARWWGRWPVRSDNRWANSDSRCRGSLKVCYSSHSRSCREFSRPSGRPLKPHSQGRASRATTRRARARRKRRSPRILRTRRSRRSGPPSDGAARRGRTRSITHGGTGTRRRTTPGTDAPAGRRVGAIACGRDPRRRCGAAAPAV